MTKNVSFGSQFLIAVLAVGLVCSLCFLLSDVIGYKVVALILLLVVSLLAIFFHILPVLTASVLSALAWNFLFIPPRFTFSIHSAEDTLLFLMYFIIALLNGVLTYKIRQIEKEAAKKEEEAKAVKLYNVFINSLSHELRTPISTIIGATDSILANSGKISGESQTQLLHEISHASLRLNRHVENLLNVSRLESGFLKLKKDWCDVGELVHNVAHRLEEELIKHEVKIDIEENLPLYKLDHGVMDQALANILTNNAAYTPPGSKILISISGNEHHVMITIKDNGPGFAEEDIHKVFGKFYRAKNSSTGGTGLGLSIVKGFVEAHGGVVLLSNRKSGGAKFILDIPAETSYMNQLKNE